MRSIVAGALGLFATPALAQKQDQLRSLCSDRPSIGYSACTVDVGHIEADVGIGDWQLDRQRDGRTDTVTALDGTIRLGLADKTELRLGWAAYGHVRERDRSSGAIDRTSGTGDVELGMRQALVRPESGQPGFSLALQPFASLPIGRHRAIGAGDWGAGFIMPLGYKLGDTFSLALSPEVDAAVDEDGHGRHLAYGNVFGLSTRFTKTLRMTTEYQVVRDRDPDEHNTQSRAALSFDYLVRKMTQVDVLAIAGLNRQTPDIELSFGVSHKF